MKYLTLAGLSCIAILSACNSGTQPKSDNKVSDTPHVTSFSDSLDKAEQDRRAGIKEDSLEAQTIKTFKVKRISGKEKYGGVTKIEYLSLFEKIDEINKKAKKEMWDDEKLKDQIDWAKQSVLGGEITLYVERGTIGAANSDTYSIIVKDKDDKEVYREDLESDVPEVPGSDGNWWNYSTVFVPNRVKAPFYIYVVDDLADAPFKFEVTAVKK